MRLVVSGKTHQHPHHHHHHYMHDLGEGFRLGDGGSGELSCAGLVQRMSFRRVCLDSVL